MKTNIILLVFNFAILTSCGSTKYLVSFPEPIVKVYDAKGTQDELFLASNRWIISIFKDARDIIQYSDKTQGSLIGKYLLYFPQSLSDYSQEIFAVIEITVKEDKARISINPGNWSYEKYNYGVPYWSGTQDSRIYSKERAIADIDALCESFRKSLQVESVKF